MKLTPQRPPIFGVAGNPPNFWASQYRKHRTNAPEWLHGLGLDALEIQCTYGVRMNDESAARFRENAEKYGVVLSIHAPYYIGLANPDVAKHANTLNELAKSVALAKKIGSSRVILHPGAVYGDRGRSLETAIATLMTFVEQNDLGGVSLFPEIAGKVGQLGSLDEILAMCQEMKSIWPCLDLAHLHAREGGSLEEATDYERLFDKVISTLGAKATQYLHVHMYPVAWNVNGEVTHKAFGDVLEAGNQCNLFASKANTQNYYYPRYEPFLETVHRRGFAPTIICEAKDSQDVGALLMKRHYLSLMEQNSWVGQRGKNTRHVT